MFNIDFIPSYSTTTLFTMEWPFFSLGSNHLTTPKPNDYPFFLSENPCEQTPLQKQLNSHNPELCI